MRSNPAEPQREMLSLLTARIRDAYIRKPYYLDGATDLVSSCRELSANGLTHALVRDRDAAGQERLGMFTTTDLRDALLRDTPPAQLGPRPFFLVEDMSPGPLKTELQACAQRPAFTRRAWSIGHRGAPLQFPEHTWQLPGPDDHDHRDQPRAAR